MLRFRIYGKGKHKTQLQRDIDPLMSMGDKRHRYLDKDSERIILEARQGVAVEYLTA